MFICHPELIHVGHLRPQYQRTQFYPTPTSNYSPSLQTWPFSTECAVESTDRDKDCRVYVGYNRPELQCVTLLPPTMHLQTISPTSCRSSPHFSSCATHRPGIERQPVVNWIHY
jgi:hypothetical protein